MGEVVAPHVEWLGDGVWLLWLSASRPHGWPHSSHSRCTVARVQGDRRHSAEHLQGEVRSLHSCFLAPLMNHARCLQEAARIFVILRVLVRRRGHLHVRRRAEGHHLGAMRAQATRAFKLVLS